MALAKEQPFTATRNACKLCTPLGAALAFKGIENTVALLHGSQGCSTYIRRYLISHFKEPVDIACSNFAEQTAIFGGAVNLKVALDNIRRQYDPQLIGIATTCLSETIGDDVPMFVREYIAGCKEASPPPLVHVSTPSYSGTHADGFHGAVNALVSALAEGGEKHTRINMFPSMASPADLRHLKQIMDDFHLPYTMVPDYSRTLDGPLWDEYKKIPEGGTPVESIRETGRSAASIVLGGITVRGQNAGQTLEARFGVPCHQQRLPIGVAATDHLFDVLESVSGRSMPERYQEQRGRLLDAYVDGHKYVSGVTAALYGECDLVAGVAGFLSEIGIRPVLCASGAPVGVLKTSVGAALTDMSIEDIAVMEDADFLEIEEKVRELKPDLIIGHSKGYSVARKVDIPLVRIGFPIHDRFGGGRMRLFGYEGTQEIFDRIVNTIIETRQVRSGIGYSYI